MNSININSCSHSGTKLRVQTKAFQGGRGRERRGEGGGQTKNRKETTLIKQAMVDEV